MEPGTLYLSLYESGAIDNTSYWLDVLRVLLAPLRTPALFKARGGVTRECVAWLRPGLGWGGEVAVACAPAEPL